MKLSGLALLAGVVVGTVFATPAMADRVVVDRTVTTTHSVDNHPHWRGHRGKVCRTMWHHHRRVTRCRWR